MPKIICLLQARMSSSRLPNKVLKPIAGMPLVVLAAKRAANTGLDVRVVTSTDTSDDILEKALFEHSIKYFRGSLHNTLARFNAAVKGEEETSIVVRLTGDNLFPDGKFIEEVVSHFIEHNLDLSMKKPTAIQRSEPRAGERQRINSSATEQPAMTVTAAVVAQEYFSRTGLQETA